MKNLKVVIILAVSCLTSINLLAQANQTNENIKKVYIKPYGGFIGIQDMTLAFVGNNKSHTIGIEKGFGLTSGISLGYNFTSNFTAEVGWEYKTNTITVTDNSMESTGDYASNFIYLNGIYNFTTSSKFKPYLGLGLSYIQEIDLDFGTDDNTSFSNFGLIGFQGLAGLDFNLSKRWALNWEAKLATFSTFDLLNEGNNTELKGLKYNPFIFNIGVKFRL